MKSNIQNMYNYFEPIFAKYINQSVRFKICNDTLVSKDLFQVILIILLFSPRCRPYFQLNILIYQIYLRIKCTQQQQQLIILSNMPVSNKLVTVNTLLHSLFWLNQKLANINVYKFLLLIQ
ncbi:hypothetical protein TTHERM_000705250 (macronuclear) [Tetrahymena thermophila SB210]|uniref:Uncharacterized protein n=1 Tax=Tetrahymena thermophila (strain SB210) TaxID=312017 RepID=W7XDM9_TETTS|nr:hypothetical protein TTHERM_000705250 [Tetrahymena thermophila SB210]EWS75687.1 hypothetical protein TTHERM_000705250 [Tetrahymena thermophila SB210]|eukprot:XP_012651760.1 hypothetical protein TTHERM_000705250 [Tetrahymena thermophila SB210]